MEAGQGAVVMFGGIAVMLPAVHLQTAVTGDIRGGVTTRQLPPRALHQPGPG